MAAKTDDDHDDDDEGGQEAHTIRKQDPSSAFFRSENEIKFTHHSFSMDDFTPDGQIKNFDFGAKLLCCCFFGY